MSDSQRSIVMVDWSRQNDPTPGNRNQFLWQQMVLALLYDNVLAQDETIVCSGRMARWFHDEESLQHFEQLLVCGGIGVLKRPWHRYPEELKEMAQQAPIRARRLHLSNFSVNNDGDSLNFDARQVSFHDRLERLLQRYPSAHRDAGAGRLNKDLMLEFGQLLTTVLTDKRYQKWLKGRFKSITPVVADQFVEFIADPAKAVAHYARRNAGRMPKFTPLPGGGVAFTTALAVQVASTYERQQARALQGLIETVFARPFCQDEGADGRYGRLLSDLPVATNDTEPVDGAPDIRRVEVDITVPVTLPLPGRNFGEIIQRVRESQSGRNLRHAMSDLGADLTFSRAKGAWSAVANELAQYVGSSGKEISVKMLVAASAKEVLWGTAAELLVHPPSNALEAAKRAAGPLLRAGMGISGELFERLRSAELERQRLSSQLDQLLDFRCVKHPTADADPKPGLNARPRSDA